ncbi:MAG: hypothetical protein AAF363_15615 [Bacteroidota bacterium]
MKLEIKGIIDSVHPARKAGKGFRQMIVVRQPPKTDEFGDPIMSEQYFPISIYSQSESSSRFVAKELLGEKVNAKVYLNGRKWVGNRGAEYAINANLKELERIKIDS